MRYLDVIVVLASQPHGQFTFGPGTSFPQPTHFRRELQVRVGHWRQVAFSHKRRREEEKVGGEEIEKGNGGKVVKAKKKKSYATSGVNHKHRE